jgi:hypothetical protein
MKPFFSAIASGYFYRFPNAAFEVFSCPRLQFFSIVEAIPPDLLIDKHSFYFGNLSL